MIMSPSTSDHNLVKTDRDVIKKVASGKALKKSGATSGTLSSDKIEIAKKKPTLKL